MAVLAVLVCGLWPQTAEAVECENEMGSCKVELDGDMVAGSCACADCSPAIGWNFGSPGDEPMPEPTEADCLDALAAHCEGEPITDAADVCAPDALELCQGGLVEFYMDCDFAPTNREEEICITVACCEQAEEMGIEALTEFWECVSQYEDCEEAAEACSQGDGDGDGGGGMGDDGDSEDGDGNQGTGTGTGTDDGAEEGDGSEDKKGCSCSTGAGTCAAPLLLLPLLAVARRRPAR
jgi:hypothetical protein